MTRCRMLLVLACVGVLSVSTANAGDRADSRTDRGKRPFGSRISAFAETPVFGGKIRGMDECERDCFQSAREGFVQCVRDGGQADECALQQYDELQACFAEECGHVISCEDDCRTQAEAAFLQCREDGGTVEYCMLVGHREYEQCLIDECSHEPTCRQECRMDAEAAYLQCRDDGGSVFECAMEARAALRDCLAEYCYDSPNCMQQCQQDAEDDGGGLREI